MKRPHFFEIFQKDFFRGKIASVLKGPFLTALIIKKGTNFRARLLTKLLFEQKLFCFALLDRSLVRTNHIGFSFLTVFPTENYFSVWHLLWNKLYYHTVTIFPIAQVPNIYRTTLRKTLTMSCKYRHGLSLVRNWLP